MRIFDFFRRYTLQKRRRAELEFNRQIAELSRQAAGIKRQYERLRAEAVHYEQTGDHKRAVSAAAAAVHQEKNYLSAMNTLQTCKNMHEQAKSQKALKELITTCSSVARSVSRDADVAGMISAQSDFTQTMEALEQTRDELEAIQEGFHVDTEMNVRNEAGEQALAQIMGTVVPAIAPAAANEVVTLPAEKDAAALQAEHKAWADERMRLIDALAENA